MKTKILLTLILILAVFLRFYKLESNPPGFYSDEASYAYNAYSILRTGHDEHGRFLPLTFEAFGDYKLPVMLYSIVLSFLVFLPSEWAARLPGALYGTTTVFMLYLLTKELLTKTQKQNTSLLQTLPLVSAFLLAITPAHIFVSRGTWELTPALFFITLGTWAFLRWVKSNELQFTYFFIWILSFILSVYSYNSARVFVPLFTIFLLIFFHKPILQKTKTTSFTQKTFYAVITLVAFALMLPLVSSLTSPQVVQRAKYISVFYDKGVDSRMFDAIRSDSGQSVLLTRLLHNKINFYGGDVLKRYFSHFDPNFLFTIGDTFEIFQIIGVGFLPIISLPFLILGSLSLLRTRPYWFTILLVWLLLSPIASAFTIFTPSTSRAQNMVIPLTILTAYGIFTIINYTSRHKGNYTKPLYLSITAIYLIYTGYFLHQYFVITPKIVAEKWNDGFQESVKYVQQVENKYDRVIISSSQAPSYIFYLWYLKYDPATYQAQSQVEHTPDENGLNFTSKFDKFTFTKNIKEEEKKIVPGEKVLIIGFKDELSGETRKIYSRNGKITNEIKGTYENANTED